jgi:superfamily II DNA/RNA helicase
MVHKDDKFNKFLELLRVLNNGQKIIVFCRMKTTVDEVARDLR